MAKQLKLRRGTTTQHSTFTGASGEVTVDTTKKTLVVHDGVTAGGVPLVPVTDVSTSGGASKILKTDASGNLGLGVTPSTWSTGKAQEFNTVGNAVWSTGANDLRLLANIYYNGGYKYATTASASMYQVSGGYHSWYTAASGTAGNSISFTQAMTLDSSGNLLVAKTSADGNAKVDVSGVIKATGSFKVKNAASNLSYYEFEQNAAGTAYTYVGGDGRSTGYLFFATNDTERARITSSGYLKASNTGSYLSSTGAYHEFISSGNGSDTVAIVNTSAGPYGLYLLFSGASPNNTTNYFLAGSDNAATRFVLRSNGGLANYQANNINLSDRREKTNFAPAGEYLAKICAIPVQTFNYIDQNFEEDDGLTLGVVAQDVQEVAPELVMESNWGTAEEPKMRLSIYQTDLQYALMKSIQELKEIVDAQAAEIALLKQGGV